MVKMTPVNEDFRIRGQHIYLRPITAEDTDMVVAWRNHDEVVKNFIYRKPISREEHLNWLETKVNTGLVHQFVVCMNEDDMPIGSVYLQHFDEENSKAESGIFLGDECEKGKGIGTESLRLLMKYAFEVLGLHKLMARALSYNMASLKLHEKAGYLKEAYLKDELFIEGKYEDLVLFGAINPKHGDEQR
jgi:UDP-4-amino-4,6-dideoxy-N-acetyl-beta-L-altrosamine N-acetyltransferase